MFPLSLKSLPRHWGKSASGSEVATALGTGGRSTGSIGSWEPDAGIWSAVKPTPPEWRPASEWTVILAETREGRILTGRADAIAVLIEKSLRHIAARPLARGSALQLESELLSEK
jgi:hypothetical protein